MNPGRLHNFWRIAPLLLLIMMLAVACTPSVPKPPEKVEGLEGSKVTEVSGDSDRTLLLTANGELWVSGLNIYGDLGLGAEDTRLVKVTPKPGENSPPPYPSQNKTPGYLPGPVEVADGVRQAVLTPHAGAYLTTQGELWVMGYERDLKYFSAARQALANAAPSAAQQDTVRPLKVEDGVAKIVAGRNLFFLKENGDLYGTGDNHWGELGTVQMVADPHLVDQDVVDVFSGFGAVFYLKGSGDLYACGRNIWGKLGFGEPLKDESFPPPPGAAAQFMNTPPQLVAEDVEAVFSTDYSTLLLRKNGNLYMLGKNISNIYQDGSAYQATPQLIAEEVRKMGIAELEWEEQTVLALTKSNKLLAWGANLSRLGIEGQGAKWVEIASDVKDFWTTPNLFVLDNSGKMRATGAPADVNIEEKDIGQWAGWSWD